MKILIFFLATTLSAYLSNSIAMNRENSEENSKDDSVFDKILAINEEAFKTPLDSPYSNIYQGDIVMTDDVQRFLAGRPKRKIYRNIVKRLYGHRNNINKRIEKDMDNSKDDSVFDNILAINLKAYKRHGPGGVPNLFEGDIMVSDKRQEQLNLKRGAHSNPAKLWRLVNGVREIPFLIDSKVADLTTAIYKAMDEWEEAVPCLRFVQRTNQKDYIYFMKGVGCVSPVGREGGKQNISLGESECGKHGTILHEIGHSLGFWHEQSRPDRDKYINIIWKNIIPSMRFNFDKEIEVNSLGVPYDYDSIMHYGPYAFSIDPDHAPTILTKKGRKTGHRHHLSKSDILQAKLMYKCFDTGNTNVKV